MLNRLHFGIVPLFMAACALYFVGAGTYQKRFSFTVPGNSDWVDTELYLRPGTLVKLKASGIVDVGGGWGKYGPEGTRTFADGPGNRYPAETPYRYGLVGRVAVRGAQEVEDWSYGEAQDHCAAQGGRLLLIVNDDAPEDNKGEFVVSVELGECPASCMPWEKSCDGSCVRIDDPHFGCSRRLCDPCDVQHARSSCRSFACDYEGCISGWTDLDGDRANGCEFSNPNLIGWLDSSVGIRVATDDGRISSWWSRQFEYLSATEIQSGFWPLRATVDGRNAVRFGPDLPGGLPGPYNRRGLYLREGCRDCGVPGRPMSLTNTAYTIFAVVQRDSARADNYFLVSEGTGCNIGGCDANSALHLGWQGDRTIRLGQYYNDLDLRDVPPFNSARPALSLIIASSDTTGKFVSLDEPGFSREARNREGTLLRHGEPLRVGGGDGIHPPDFLFSGYIFEIMIYNARLSPVHFNAVKSYLRRKYGL